MRQRETPMPQGTFQKAEVAHFVEHATPKASGPASMSSRTVTQMNRSRFAAPFIATGQLVPLLEQWMPPPSDGFFLYYPSRRQNLASLRAFIEFLLRTSRRTLWTQQRKPVDTATQ
jgi:hypothetical protein